MSRTLPSLLAFALLAALPAIAQQSPLIQPGAPGQPSHPISPSQASSTQHAPTQADYDFIQGMIMHHGQAVRMTELLRTRSQNPEVRALGDRIRVSQSDEMRWMKQWLTDRGQAIETDHMNMPGMDMPMPMMPGMLSAAQMDALAKSTGPAFDHLFLTGMIQHHTGALTMVQQLFATPAAAQDATLFDFVTDVENTQAAEIRIMQGLLTTETTNRQPSR
jgi:uncharacterized protein (DUF305 family)